MTAVLPSLNHTVLSDWNNVYEPSDDTFLLCDALNQDKVLFIESKPEIAIEIGYLKRTQ